MVFRHRQRPHGLILAVLNGRAAGDVVDLQEVYPVGVGVGGGGVAAIRGRGVLALDGDGFLGFPGGEVHAARRVGKVRPADG